jgi:hypothetical protein
MQQKRIISQSAFDHRVREAAYYLSARLQARGEEQSDSVTVWLRAERDEQTFLNRYDIWVVPDDEFKGLVRDLAHSIWANENPERELHDKLIARTQLLETLQREPTLVEVDRLAYGIFSARRPGDEQSDWERARYKISGGLDRRA